MNTAVHSFIRSTAKNAAAIFLALLGLAAVIAAYFWLTARYEERQAKPYEVVRDWNVDLTENLSLKLNARTKVVDRQMLVSVRIAGYPSYLDAPQNQAANITLHFLDKDNFKIYSKPMPIRELSSIVGPDSKKTGLNGQFQEFMSIDTYKRFEKLVAEWTLETNVTSKPNWESAPVLPDPCTPNLSKAERLKRLAQYGEVRQNGANTFSAGNRSLAFFDDGTLLDCR